ncbi:MAG: T9SS type A sorting domain-containing protein, partial [Ignavibacteriaceae bacterium]
SVFFVNSDIGFAVGGVGTILATIDGGIPVELSSFTANANVNSVTLNWSTSSELNNRGFEIERFSGSWEKIGFVEGYGTTTEIQSYSFIDDLTLNHSLTPNLSYRLKQIDFDGTFQYSPTVEVEIGIPEQFALFQNYPNPFNPSTIIKFTIPSSSFVNLTVYDILGKEVSRLVNEVMPAGNYEIKFDASKLSSGIHYYKLSAGDYSMTKKMILLR